MLQLIKDSDEKVIFSSKDHVNVDESFVQYNSLSNLYPNWYSIDNKLFYFKSINDSEKLLNELLGPYLANFYGLDSIQYDLGYLKDKKETGLLSKSFYKEGYEYTNLSNIVTYNVFGTPQSNCLTDVLNLCKTKKEEKDLILQILNLCVLDFYSHQIDRISMNIEIQTKPKIALGPIFDYSESFNFLRNYNEVYQYYYPSNNTYYEKNEYIYGNDLIKLNFPSQQMEDLFAKYPEFYQSVKRILDINLKKYISLIESEKDLHFSQSLKDFYYRYDERKKNFVRKII